MKRTNKIISMFLIWAMLLTGCYAVLTSIGVKLNKQTQTVSAGTTIYEEGFDYGAFKTTSSSFKIGSNNWAKGDIERTDGSAPTITGGVAKFTTKQNMQYNWKNLVSYSSSATYTFTFEIKMTSAGSSDNTTYWGTSDNTRSVFIAFGGYYNQIELPNKSGQIRAGDTYKTYDSATHLNNWLSVKIVLKGTTATTTICNMTRTELISGSRTNNAYTSTSDKWMPYLAFRCEDGAFELDNFAFYADGIKVYTETFNTQTTAIFSNGNWTSGDLSRTNGALPELSGDMLKFTTKENISFNWSKLVNYSSTKTYTFTFDFNVSNAGNGATWDSADCTRAMYISFGGWYNLIEINDKNSQINLCEGSKTLSYSANYLSAKIVLSGSSITSTIYTGAGQTGTAYSGTRTLTFDAYMARLSFRCEDGAFQIDNFKFTDGSTTHSEDFTLSNSKICLTNSGIWKQGDSSLSASKLSAPTVSGSALKLSSKQGTEVNWRNYTTYSTTKEYVFTFNFTVTNSGAGNSATIDGSEAYTRALYVAFGGWYNLIEVNDKNGNVSVAGGKKTIAYNESNHKDKVLTGKIVLCGTRAYVSVSNGNTVLVSSFRDDIPNDEYLPYLSFRCEDGGVTVDTLKIVEESGHSFTNKSTSNTYLKSAATCTTVAEYYTCCSRCGLSSKGQTGEATFTSGSVNASNHTGSSVNGGTSGVHTKYSCCGATISTTHSYTKTTQTAATCTVKGTSKYTCSCGYSYTSQDINALGHSWDNACDTTCNRGCGETRSITHNWGNWSSTGESQHSRSCTVCKVSETQDHSLSDWITTDASNHYKTCSVCSAKVQQSTHNYDNSCDTSCNTCGHTRSINHTYNGIYGYNESGHWEICDVCSQNGSLQSHSFGAWEIIETPTLTTDGLERRECAVCDYYEEQAVSVLNSASLSIEGAVEINMYIDIKKYTQDLGAYVELEYNHNNLDYTPNYKTTRITNLEEIKQSDGTYKFSVSFASGQIADVINLRVYDEQGVLKYEKLNYSILAYCQNVIATSSDNDLKNLCKSLINYGVRAIDYFGYSANLPNATSSYLQTLDMQTEISYVPQASVSQEQATNLSVSRYSFVALSDTSIRIYFNILNGYAINAYNIALNRPTNSSMNFRTGYNDYGYFVEVYGIESANIDALFTITLTFKGDNSTTTLTYSALNYIDKIIKETTNQKLKDMCIAIYQYNLCAKAYFTNENPWEIF